MVSDLVNAAPNQERRKYIRPQALPGTGLVFPSQKLTDKQHGAEKDVAIFAVPETHVTRWLRKATNLNLGYSTSADSRQSSNAPR